MLDKKKLMCQRDKLKSEYNKLLEFLLARLSYQVQPHELRNIEIVQITRNKNNIRTILKLKEVQARYDAIFRILIEA